MNRIVSSLIFGLALISLVAPRQADATPSLEFYDGTTTKTVVDNGAGDFDSTSGDIFTVATVGSWTLNITVGTSTPVIGSSTNPHLRLSSLDTKASGSSDLRIRFSDTGFSSPVGWVASINGTQTTGTIEYQTYLDNGNAIFGTTTLLTNSGCLCGPGYANTMTSGFVGTSPFSLTQVVTLHSTGATSKDFTATLQPVPEPASLLLLGSGLIGLSGFGFWRRKNKQA